MLTDHQYVDLTQFNYIILICHIISPRYYVDNTHVYALRKEPLLQSLETHINVELTAGVHLIISNEIEASNYM